jgi:iron-sulfur cluster assembly protein
VPGSLKGQGSIRKEQDCMLTITDTAAEAIKGIVASPQVPEGAGLRIATRPESPTEGAFEVSVAPVPAEEDQVVEESGAQVFLEPHAAEALDDKVLDAEIEGGEVRFAVGEQT